MLLGKHWFLKHPLYPLGKRIFLSYESMSQSLLLKLQNYHMLGNYMDYLTWSFILLLSLKLLLCVVVQV